MSLGTTITNIRKAYLALSGKMVDVSLTFKGTELGENSPWLARCDTYETKHSTDVGAVESLFKQVIEELQRKATSTEIQAQQYRKAFNSFHN